MTKIIKMKKYLLLGMFAVEILSCKKDKDPIDIPMPVNEPEIITTLQLQFTDSANSSHVILVQFKDPDGDGGSNPTQFDSLKLPANKTWYCQTTLLNESVNPAENINESILEEAEEHLFVYSPENLNLDIAITDKDANNLPIGLKSKWKTGSTSLGKVKVVLKHQPGSKDGNPANGETDVEVIFPARIY